jgi:hypothetical protein
MAGTDPKPTPPKRDPQSMRIAKLREPWCVVCWEQPTMSAHHVLYRSGGAYARGDDIAANIVGVCGTDNNSGCHGLLHRSDPTARARLGRHIIERRPDTVAYLHGRLGETADEWIRTHLQASVAEWIGRRIVAAR